MCGPGKTKNRARRNHFESGLLAGKSLFSGAITIRAWGFINGKPGPPTGVYVGLPLPILKAI
ncbi:hypothetical protein NQ317_008807 [Molorchus minor]|uniref:Uncharacterized protein n=1 Tax=Molorchus minor TaxID=1323400 RepID=A0ABQ9IZJ2_9CUCU|nr:hypothetical protein NQ317_010587 [Molorchus minor]KAJ8969739.1 hypothetical protein NQ317_008807 [Molorchus minor]